MLVPRVVSINDIIRLLRKTGNDRERLRALREARRGYRGRRLLEYPRTERQREVL